MKFVTTVTSATLAGLLVMAVPVPSQGAANIDVARWEMDEPAEATTMVDSSGNGIHGSIGSAVKTGFSFSGATGYQWLKTNPNEAPAKPERLVTANNPLLNPGTADFSVTMRFRTTHDAGNMIQKGQAATPGGYFKWQNVKGKVTCLMRGYAADGTMLQKAVNSGLTPLNDGQWHTLVCERTADRVTLTIDGSRVRRALGPTGSISNTSPLTLAGKYTCDQVKITCDYFSGEMDYVVIRSASTSGTGTSDTGGTDTVAPFVSSTTPAAGATGVLRGSNLAATFSEAVTGVDASTMTLHRDSNGAQIVGAVTYSASTRTATLNPDVYLAANTRYTVTLTNGIKDSAGNALSRTSWSFTTGG